MNALRQWQNRKSHCLKDQRDKRVALTQSLPQIAIAAQAIAHKIIRN